jgi:hypothetical protein
MQGTQAIFDLIYTSTLIDGCDYYLDKGMFKGKNLLEVAKLKK